MGESHLLRHRSRLTLGLLLYRYKAIGANAVDATGELDTVEFINVSKDDALAWPERARRDYPRTVNARMVPTIGPFVRKSVEVNNTLLDALNDKLGLPKGTLLRLHPINEFSGSETRVTHNPPTMNTQKVAIGSHTDFGSLVRHPDLFVEYDLKSLIYRYFMS